MALAFKTNITIHLENFQVSIRRLKTVTMLPEQKIKIKKYRPKKERESIQNGKNKLRLK